MYKLNVQVKHKTAKHKGKEMVLHQSEYITKYKLNLYNKPPNKHFKFASASIASKATTTVVC